MPSTIDALTRGLDVLALLLEPRHSLGMQLRELHAATGIPKASLTDILYTLEARGVATRRHDLGLWLVDRNWLLCPVTYAAHLANVHGLLRPDPGALAPSTQESKEESPDGQA